MMIPDPGLLIVVLELENVGVEIAPYHLTGLQAGITGITKVEMLTCLMGIMTIVHMMGIETIVTGIQAQITTIESITGRMVSPRLDRMVPLQVGIMVRVAIRLQTFANFSPKIARPPMETKPGIGKTNHSPPMALHGVISTRTNALHIPTPKTHLDNPMDSKIATIIGLTTGMYLLN